MLRIPIAVRPNLAEVASQNGFDFHTIDGDVYWDESAYYQFTLSQIENDLEDPTEALHQLCLDLVNDVVRDQQLMERLAIPPHYWDAIANSWNNGYPSLYGRMDFSYDGKSPAKLLEYNADTPTSVYEAGAFQWIWLAQQVDAGLLSRNADQFNSIQEKLIQRFAELKSLPITFTCCRDTDEDRGTVAYLEDCARQGGVATRFVYLDDIGINDRGQFIHQDDSPIKALFKLYPWEMMFNDSFGHYLPKSDSHFLEPMWKAILSNKGILPLLWQRHPNHPNLLPAYFADESPDLSGDYIRKPLLGREGANIEWLRDGQSAWASSDQGYGEEGYVLQQAAPLPQFDGNHTLIGSWLVDDKPAGLTIREDNTAITQDTSRFVPHIILGD
ncbi:glutathionylspermidine synthase family protein [Neiella marina]|uniref:Glutathionylspermidine synthase family protein n=1 Tax=Neiella holothuriorum TaxID=2870530 RepID=A0ABS7ED11_9GAMM|nr:glutathionylspermidine synthase family protein [Neiella holothuriorum]MBW8190140.1 glutathionylspermidine synthase family protein [Neiella holothuriorum]